MVNGLKADAFGARYAKEKGVLIKESPNGHMDCLCAVCGVQVDMFSFSTLSCRAALCGVSKSAKAKEYLEASAYAHKRAGATTASVIDASTHKVRIVKARLTGFGSASIAADAWCAFLLTTRLHRNLSL